MDSALGPNDYEYVDATLTRLLRAVVQQTPHGAAARRWRDSGRKVGARRPTAHCGPARRVGRTRRPPEAVAVSALSTRLLRPGARADRPTRWPSDRHRAWDRLQQQAGLRGGRAGDRLWRRLRADSSARTSARYGDQVFSMLWPRGYQARSHTWRTTSRTLAKQCSTGYLSWRPATSDCGTSTSPARLAGRVLTCSPAAVPSSSPPRPASQRAEPGAPGRACLPVDRDVLRVYGEVREVVRVGAELRAVIDVREAVQ